MKAADWLNLYNVNTCKGQIIKEPFFVVLMLAGFFLVAASFQVWYISFVCVTVVWKINF